jgi:release factor glutamine methyltransferase
MNNIKSILYAAKTQLANSEIVSSGIDADLLLAYVLQTTRETLIGYPERVLSDEQIQQFDELVQRRMAREPMAHILGIREFWGREFKVNGYTLDPRPDSETLIEAALALFTDKKQLLNIVDFGTGTGCLLLTLLAEMPYSTGTCVDISAEVLAVAKENANNLGLANRAKFVVSSWGEQVQEKYDLIISNPPYIKTSDIQGLEPEVADYEPKTALDGGDDGLRCYRDLAPYIASLLADNGFAILEYGMGQHNDVRSILENVGLQFVAFKNDLAGINRCIIVRACC